MAQFIPLFACFVVIIVLNPLQEIEDAHHNLLKTLSDTSVNQESEDRQCPSATVSRTPSLDRGSINGETENNFISPQNQTTQ